MISTPIPLVHLKESLLCPVECTLLRTAVNLVPCSHKVNQAVAEHIYGRMMKDQCEKKNVPCPLCRVIVKQYYPDHIIRNLINQIFPDTSENEDQDTSLLSDCIIIRTDCPNYIHFPGKKGKFVLASGSWKIQRRCPLSDLVMSINFGSMTRNSFFRNIRILGHKKGNVTLHVRIHPSYEKDFLTEYFLSHGFTFDHANKISYHTHSSHLFCIRSHDNLQKIFNIIVANNELPAEHVPKFRSLIETGTWKTIETS